MIKGDEGNEYEIEKIEYYNFAGKKIKVEFRKNIPQYQESDNFILLNSQKKAFNSNITPLWKKHKDGSYSRIFSKNEYCTNFSYNALYKIAYPVKIRFLKKNFSESGEIEFDDYGIATFKGFEETFSDEKGNYAIISKKN